MEKDETTATVHLVSGATIQLPEPDPLPSADEYVYGSIIEINGHYYERMMTRARWERLETLTPQQYLRRVRFRVAKVVAFMIAVALMLSPTYAHAWSPDLVMVGLGIAVILVCIEGMSARGFDSIGLRFVVIGEDRTVEVRSGSLLHAFSAGSHHGAGHVERTNS
jgi:hypothetical protein